MRQQTNINRIRRDYPNIMEGYHGTDGMDDKFFDDLEPDYDEELETEDYHRV